MHRLTLGDLDLTILSDGNYLLDGGAFFGVIPKVMWSKRMQPDDLNRLSCGLNSVLVRGAKKVVLIETGIGNKIPDRMKKIYAPEEKLLRSLDAVGVAPEEIDVVINTHLHFDHCGWNTVYRNGRVLPTFPNARYYVQRGEWEYAQRATERDRISYISDNYNPLVESGQMELIDGARELLPGISVEVYPGHTQHLQAVSLESNGKRACYISDLIPTTAHLDIAWGMAFDLFPLDTIASKKKFYARAIPENWLMIFTHDPKRPWAYVDLTEDGKYVARAVSDGAERSGRSAV